MKTIYEEVEEMNMSREDKDKLIEQIKEAEKILNELGE